MKYTIELDVNQSRAKILELMDDPDNLFKWQEGIQSFDIVSGEQGQVGTVSKQRHKMGKREIEMTETITARNLPDEFSAVYEADNVWNQIENFFSENADGSTHWKLTSEFRCTGFMKVMCWVFPGMFKKQTQKFMNDFKNFAESK